MKALEEATSSASGVTLQVSPTETRVVVRGELGHADWKLVRSACDIAKRNNNALVIDLSDCASVSRWGIGVILKARERAGSVHLRGCSDRLTHFFDGLNICAICGRRSNPDCIAKRAALRPLTVRELNVRLAEQSGPLAGA